VFKLSTCFPHELRASANCCCAPRRSETILIMFLRPPSSAVRFTRLDSLPCRFCAQHSLRRLALRLQSLQGPPLVAAISALPCSACSISWLPIPLRPPPRSALQACYKPSCRDHRCLTSPIACRRPLLRTSSSPPARADSSCGALPNPLISTLSRQIL